jgi:hypothetical protein
VAEPTVADVVSRALDAQAILEARAADVPEEWQYVTDLVAAWRGRLASVAAARGTEPVDPPTVAAIAEAAEEAALIADPHRAIDWLSTLPQIALAALGEPT